MKTVQTHLGYFHGGQSRIYPNLNPSATIPIEREQIFHLTSFFDNFRMYRGTERAQYVPNSRMVFVRTTGGEMLMHPRYRHPSIANGRPVLYAGEAKFDNGKLTWWSNGSGNYRPDAAHAVQAGLPMDQFYTCEDILKGVHERPRGPKAVSLQAKMLLHRHPAARLSPGNIFPHVRGQQ